MRNQRTSGNWNIPAEELRRAGIGEQGIAAMNNQVEMSRGWNDALVPLGALRTTGTGVPDLVEINSSSRWGLSMTNEGTANNEKRLFASAQLSHGIRRGSEVRFHIHFVTETAPGDTDKYVYWETIHSAINLPGQVISSATPKTVMYKQTIKAYTPAYTYGIVTLATLIDEDVRESSIYGAYLRRKSSDATYDTYTGTIYILSADAHIYIEKTGSFEEYPR